MDKFYRDTWVEVNLDDIRTNILTFRQHIPKKTEIMAVVKADAYGHGSVAVAREALAAGATALAVAFLDEGIVLRKAGIKCPILILGYTPIRAVQKAFEWNISCTVFQTNWIKKAEKILSKKQEKKKANNHADNHGDNHADKNEDKSITKNAQDKKDIATQGCKRLSVHINIDTGMGRIGVRTKKALLSVAKGVYNSEVFQWDGIYTHFATADSQNVTYLNQQFERFQDYLGFLKRKGFKLPAIHCCNTAAAMTHPEWGFNYIRLGIGMYGLYPSVYIKSLHILNLKPALQVKTRVSNVKFMQKPLGISYGVTYIASPGEQIITLPIGYGDGFSRLLSNKGSVLLQGKRFSVVGRITMDQCMVSVNKIKAKVGDEVVIYGRSGKEEITLEEVAELMGTINYEVACMLNYRLPRVYTKQNKIVSVRNLLGSINPKPRKQKKK
ncbi:alanine racemase [Brevibacillus laterosporus]|uniref:Alanine racemase n=1 Tax=Brevibacillus laterosporus LMG 15441 TaxID=1042163 RepID=A0A075RB51_BRELA|nr:alanine racemase [Brevibacillus laterosporus]AIG28458.1 alanine racemase [Brevibacillus laterosporus LMG 15441]RJL13523.1 alanine racemase [Brevibacillus laterosporus]TPH17429.1 alanine racemase [Brevibacillus laterosporus]